MGWIISKDSPTAAPRRGVWRQQLRERLCNDGKWRSFANFGSFPECVKVYRRLGNCTRKQSQLAVRGIDSIAHNLKVYEVDASGFVYRTQKEN